MRTLALVGCGRISFKHIEAAIKNADRLRLVATCDPRMQPGRGPSSGVPEDFSRCDGDSLFGPPGNAAT